MYDDYLKLASVLQEKMPRIIFRCEAFIITLPHLFALRRGRVATGGLQP